MLHLSSSANSLGIRSAAKLVCRLIINNYSLKSRSEVNILPLFTAFGGRPALQERITPSETNFWREDCLIFSNNYLEKRSQTWVCKSMNSSLNFENFQAKFRPFFVFCSTASFCILNISDS